MFIGGAHGKFIAIDMAYDDGFFGQQPFHYGSMVNRSKILKDAGRGRYGMVFVTDHIFDGHHHAMQFAGGFIMPARFIQFSCPLQRFFRIYPHVSVERRPCRYLLQIKMHSFLAAA